MKSYGRPLVSPDAFSGATSWTDWIEHFDGVAVLNDWDDAAKLRWLPGACTWCIPCTVSSSGCERIYTFQLLQD